jgi:hypothetical integral membrane protein (TIGR02206 family)
MNHSLTILAAADPTRQTWPGSPNHLLAVGICGLVILLFIAAGRVLAYEGREAALRKTLGWFAVLSFLSINGWYALPANLDWDKTLPLHVCDLANLLAALVMFFGHRVRLLRTTLYFWAFALTLHGFITPVVEPGLTSPTYWLFWLNHTTVVGLALYDVCVGGYRPTWRDLLLAAGVTLGYVALVLPINLMGGWNYGYVGRDLPATGTILNLLGDWPGRVFWLAGLGLLSFVLVYVPWPIARLFQRSWRRVG